jgi:tetratricopeptide (TPR) repeat protein
MQPWLVVLIVLLSFVLAMAQLALSLHGLLELDIARDGSFETALDALTAIENDAETPAVISLVLMGAVHYGRSEFLEAAEVFTDSIGAATAERGSAPPLLYTNRGTALIAVGSDEAIKQALKDAETAISIDKDCVRAHLLRGIALRAMGRYTDAEASLRKAAEVAALRGLLKPKGSSSGGTVTPKGTGGGSGGTGADEELLDDVRAALEELAKIRAYNGDDVVDATTTTTSAAAPPDSSASAAASSESGNSTASKPKQEDKFTALEDWLTTAGALGSSSFPLLYMRAYGQDPATSDNRGVHARANIPAEREIMAIGREFLITVEMGREFPVGRKLTAAGIDGELSAAKHCYLALFVLWDRRNEGSFFQPYYRILPSSFPNMPIFWGEDKLKHLKGSFFLQQIADRKVHLTDDYNMITKAVPEVREFCSLEEFWWARMMVASRNFGIVIDGVRTDALVPYADMLNHYRPRQTRWFFDNRKQAFVIQSLVKLHAGQQVFDSYGKKCNSRFLLNYGFAVDHNRDDDVGQNHNEVRRSSGGIAWISAAQPLTDRFPSHHFCTFFPPWSQIRLLPTLEKKPFSPAESSSPYLIKCRMMGVEPLSSEQLAGGIDGPTSTTSKTFTASVHDDGTAVVSKTEDEADAASDLSGDSSVRSAFTKSVRISTFYDNDNTAEAFSFLRFVHATSDSELALLPRGIHYDTDFLRASIRPISLESEMGVLRHLAHLCEEQLKRYPTTLEQDIAELESNRHPYGSDHRNILVLLKGEKEVCRHYINLYQTAAHIVQQSNTMTPQALLHELSLRYAVGSTVDDHDDINRYVRNVLYPLIKRKQAQQAQLAAAAAAAQQQSMAGASVGASNGGGAGTGEVSGAATTTDIYR